MGVCRSRSGGREHDEAALRIRVSRGERQRPKSDPAPLIAAPDGDQVTDNMARTTRAENRARGRKLHLRILAADRADFTPSLEAPPPREVCRQRPSSAPCPWVLCRHHLFTGEPQGRHRAPGAEPRGDWAERLEVRVTAGPSCTFDLPPRARATREIADLLGVTMRQVQSDLRSGLEKLHGAGVDYEAFIALAVR